MVYSPVNQDKRLASCRFALRSALIERMWCSRSPGVRRAINERETWVRNVVAAILVDSLKIGRGSNVEGFFTDDTLIGEVIGSRYQWKLIRRHSRPCLEESPLGAILVRPRAPGLRYIILGIEGRIVRAEALVLSIALRNTGCYLREVDIPYVIEHLRDETFTCSVLSGGDERADRVTERYSSRVQHRRRRNVATISHKGVATNLGVPVAALPVSKRSSEHTSEVVVVSHIWETKSALELVCENA